MPLVKINGVTYEFDALNEEIKTHLKFLSYIDSEIERLKMQLGTFQLSRDHVGRLLDSAMTSYALHQTPFEGAVPNAPPAGTESAA
ncbi:hypothetical protein MCEMAEM4_02773 [Burkholderiaceae bacterium]